MYIIYVFVFAIISVLATQLYCNVFTRCGCTLMKCLSDYLWQTLVPLIFFSFVWVLYRYLDQKEDLEKIKKEHTEMELKFLKSQINPHVLFNNLNTIYAYALEKPEETPDLILMLSDNLKHVLYESNAEKIPLNKELQFLDNYIKFQKLRTEGVKTINYKVETDNKPHEIAPLLLITIIENAFKHSVLNSTIDISIAIENGTLNCQCKNAYDANKTNDETFRIGLQNLNKRLSLLYINKHELTVKKNDRYTVNLTLQLE